MRNVFLVAVLFLSLSWSKAEAEVNIRTSPLHPFIGALTLDADFKIDKSWTLGPSLMYLNSTIMDFDTQAYMIGVRANYYFNRDAFTQGWYLGPAISYMNITIESTDDIFGDEKASSSGLVLSAMGGYQWMWDQFNINLGAGPVLYTLGSVEVENNNGDEDELDTYTDIGLGLEFTLGWKF